MKRFHSLDAMRAILMLMGVYFHLAHAYSIFPNTWSRNPEAVSAVFSYFIEFSHYFRMHAFFLISGFFGALLYERKGAREMIRNRFKRIFLPLIIFLWPIYILNILGGEFAKYQNQGLGIIQSFDNSLGIFYSIEGLIPWRTDHLWFLMYLFFMSIIAFLAKRIFNNINFLNGRLNKTIRLLFSRPWLGTFLFCFTYGVLVSILHIDQAQTGDAWLYWVWFLIPSGIKTFIAFSFFYFIGWHIYYHRSVLEKLNIKKQLTMVIAFFPLAIILAYNLVKFSDSPYPQMNVFFQGENSELDSRYNVTFKVDLSEFDFDQFGEDDLEFRGVFLQGTFNGWCGECNKMIDQDGDLVFTKTIEVREGFHEYIFTVNGWDGFMLEKWGWLGGADLDTECDAIPGDREGTYGLDVVDKDITLDAVCWKSCEDCSGNLVYSTQISKEVHSKRRLFDKVYYFLWNFLVPVQVMLVLALFVNLLNGESKRLRYISDASYWVYIIHLPLTHFIPGLFHQSSMNVFIKFTIASVIVTGICFGTYHYLVRSTFIGEILNGRRYSIR